MVRADLTNWKPPENRIKTVKDLIEALSKLDPEKEVSIMKEHLCADTPPWDSEEYVKIVDLESRIILEPE